MRNKYWSAKAPSTVALHLNSRSTSSAATPPPLGSATPKSTSQRCAAASQTAPTATRSVSVISTDPKPQSSPASPSKRQTPKTPPETPSASGSSTPTKALSSATIPSSLAAAEPEHPAPVETMAPKVATADPEKIASMGRPPAPTPTASYSLAVAPVPTPAVPKTYPEAQEHLPTAPPKTSAISIATKETRAPEEAPQTPLASVRPAVAPNTTAPHRQNTTSSVAKSIAAAPYPRLPRASGERTVMTGPAEKAQATPAAPSQATPGEAITEPTVPTAPTAPAVAVVARPVESSKTSQATILPTTTVRPVAVAVPVVAAQPEEPAVKPAEVASVC